jgi:hypothetical protein
VQVAQTWPDLIQNFYGLYPSRATSQFVNGTRRGYFEQIKVYCLLGFHRQNVEPIMPIVETQDTKKVYLLGIPTQWPI